MSKGTRLWVRFTRQDQLGFGQLENDQVAVYQGDMFGVSSPTGQRLPLADVKLQMPVRPGKILALWNNFAALGEKLGLAIPAEPLYFVKTPNTYANPGDVIRQPDQPVKVIYEGELAVVIGRRASAVSEPEALDYVFGYTCVNDVTAVDVLNRDASFAQWTRAKGFDGFCPLGPAIATGLDPSALQVKTVLNGQLRQDYPISDMRFSVAQLVSKISADMTLEAGDVILCGTSIGAGSMKPGSEVSVEIPGIGVLKNRFEL